MSCKMLMVSKKLSPLSTGREDSNLTKYIMHHSIFFASTGKNKTNLNKNIQS